MPDMTNEEVNAFLDSKPGWMTFTSLDRDGYPHSVPIGWIRLEDDIFIPTREGSQKVKNVERNPRVSVMVESGSTMADIKGVLIRADAALVRDPAELLRLGREAARLRGVPEDQWPAEPRPGAVYIRVPRGRTVTWDYSKRSPAGR